MTCNKLGYRTVKAARTALNNCKKVRAVKRRRRERSFYKCEFCSEFHLTSEPPNGETRFT